MCFTTGVKAEESTQHKGAINKGKKIAHMYQKMAGSEEKLHEGGISKKRSQWQSAINEV